MHQVNEGKQTPRGRELERAEVWWRGVAPSELQNSPSWTTVQENNNKDRAALKLVGVLVSLHTRGSPRRCERAFENDGRSRGSKIEQTSQNIMRRTSKVTALALNVQLPEPAYNVVQRRPGEGSGRARMKAANGTQIKEA